MSSNSFLKRARRSRFLSRSLSLFLACVLLFALLPGLETKADAAYYDDAIQKLIGWNVLRGYPDGSLNPDSNITRAEFVALINRAYGYSELRAIPFTDVAGDAWYHDDISAAYAAGYFNGTTPFTAGPSEELTREQALVLLARNMRLDTSSGEVTSFSDGRAFQSYSAGYANTAVKKGLVSGYGDGSFRPSNNITRGEMAVMLERALGNLINSEGTYALGDVFGNVTIDTTNVTLRNTTIAGDLYLTGGLGLGGVTLENVKVLGDIIVAGGGESNEGESVILRNVTADNVLVDTLLGEYVSLRAEGDTNIGRALLVSDAYLQDRTPAGLGFQTVTITGMGGLFTLSGNLEKIVNAAPYSTLRISQGIAKDLTMDEAAVGASLWLDSNATVQNLTLDTATAVTGRGDVRKLSVNVAGSSTEMLPDDIEVRPGLTGNIAGETMDTTAAAEASSEPRISAEYPRVINVSATTATATFSTNKSGTIYWAITTVADGSVNAEGLLTPASQNRIVRSGNLRAAQSNTVYNAPITGLTSGGNYYLTAMLVDARGDYSPIKVVSFTTTDNTTPAFGSGFPYMSTVEKDEAWATVMATKTCQLYWVVFDKGSSAPTPASFRSGAFTGAYGFGIRDMERNISETFKVNSLDLEELKSYDIYFWLNDADSAKSSAVKKLTFTTPDRTPPEFNPEPTVNSIAATSLKLTTSLNEAGTVYWVIVEGGEEYPKQPTTSILERDQYKDNRELGFKEYFQLQIASGMNGLKAGSVKVRANTPATINITGLTAETQYRIYFIAIDNAGNYSTFRALVPWEVETAGELPKGYDLNSNYIWASTLDNSDPYVDRLEFSLDTIHGPEPETDVTIVFNERVQYYDPPNNQIALDDAYRDLIAGVLSREDYADIMSEIFTLYMVGETDPVKERTEDTPADSDDWVIDYRNVTVRMEGREMYVTFPGSKSAGEDGAALNLGSDATYYFQVRKIADTSDRANELNGGKLVTLNSFRTIAAKVVLKNLDLVPMQIETDEGTVRADIAFSMKPGSISRVSASKSWDMFIWANQSVKFKMYTLALPASEDPPTSASHWDEVTTIDRDTGDAIAAEGEIINPTLGDDQERFVGISYWRGLKATGNNPSIRDENDGMDDDFIYYYVISATDIGGESPEHVTTDVKFWITVDTGNNNAFSFWSEKLTEDNYATSQQATDNKLTEIDEDGESLRDRYIQTATFNDGGIPDFIDGYPALEPKDTSVSVGLKLDRAATVYMAICPAVDGSFSPVRLNSAVPYEITDGNSQIIKDTNGKDITYDAETLVRFDDYDVPTSGRAYGERTSMAVFRDGSGILNKSINGDPVADDDELNPSLLEFYPHYLSSPVNRFIYNKSSEYDDVIFESVEIGGKVYKPVTVPGLTPGTEYFIYFVIRNVGNKYSSVQLYKFKTETAYRPRIAVTESGTDAVNVVSHERAAQVRYALFQMDLFGTSKLNADFVSKDVMGDKFAEYLKYYDLTEEKLDAEKEKGDDGSYPLKGYKLYDAMADGPSDSYDSYFDMFAKKDLKDEIYNIVTSRSRDDAYIGGTASSSKLVGAYFNVGDPVLPINCSEEFTLKKGLNYYILTVSNNADATDLTSESYSFRGYSPIYLNNTDPPKLVSISGSVKVDNTSKVPVVSGDITLYFDTELYYYDSTTSEGRVPLHINSEDGTKDGTTYKGAKNVVGSSSGINVKTTNFTANETAQFTTRTDHLILSIDSINNGKASITFLNRIASLYSGAIQNFTLTVDLENLNSNGTAKCTLSDPGAVGLWQDGVESTNVLVSFTPSVQNIEFSFAPQPPLAPRDTTTLTATALFDKPCQRSVITWTVDNESVAVISTDKTTSLPNTASDTHPHTVTLTGLKDGTVKITATCNGISWTTTVVIQTPPTNTGGGGDGPSGQSTMLTSVFKQSDFTLKKGDTLELYDKLELSPGAEVIGWKSDDTGVAYVGFDTGHVETVTAGTAKITARIKPASGSETTLTATITVTDS